MIRVAFTFSGGITYWTGGFNYLRNALRALNRYAQADVRPVLFVSPETRPEDIRMLAEDLIEPPVEAAWLARDRRAARFRESVVRGADSAAARAFAAQGIDVAFEAGEYYGRTFPIPALTWVADFQSHHLPELFSWRARWRTYLGRRLQLLGRRIILVSSANAAADCVHFYPASRSRVTVVRFAVCLPPDLAIDATAPERHHLPTRYYYLPNQFWQHKNHRTVIEALALARKDEPDLAIVASGSPIDHRNPRYFHDLRSLVGDLGLQDSFRFAGLISASDVPQLALDSVAVINPSLFEGWSTTVEEAKSLGVPLILSSIAVHKEQAAEGATYFEPRSREGCARALCAVWRMPQSTAAERLRSAAEGAEQRAREFATHLTAAIDRTANCDI